MARLIYFSLASLDGYIADEHGSFDWAKPDQEVHEFVNGLSRPIETMILGRLTFEVLQLGRSRNLRWRAVVHR